MWGRREDLRKKISEAAARKNKREVCHSSEEGILMENL